MNDRLELRLWLRLLASSNLVVARLRRGLKEEFGVTLPAFDLMAQTNRPPLGPTMGELSQRLMVSKGNVTDLVERLEGKGLVVRRVDAGDGRVQHVWLTPEGTDLIERMLPRHAAWLAEAMAGADRAQLERLYDDLGALKAALAGKLRPPAA